jgi:hypothetical protein
MMYAVEKSISSRLNASRSHGRGIHAAPGNTLAAINVRATSARNNAQVMRRCLGSDVSGPGRRLRSTMFAVSLTS